MVLSRLRRCFSSKPSASAAYYRLYSPPHPIPNKACALPNPAPPSPPPIYDDDDNQPGSPPPQSILIGDGGSGNEKKTSAMYRIETELRTMNEEAATHCSFGPVGDDIFRWQGVVIGPACSCYEDGIFQLSIQFPSDYPLRPPFIKFLTKIFHPHIDLDGKIYMDILNENWSSALTIEKLLLSICSLLSNPIPEGSTNEASAMYLDNWLNYQKIAREWTKLYAMPN